MGRIQKALRESRPADAIGLYRSARELWPEGEIFGAENMQAEDEYLELQEIMMAKLEPVRALCSFSGSAPWLLF